MSVAKVVIDVEAVANRGIFNSELLIIIKLILEKTAKSIATINFQLINTENRFCKFNKLPEIKDLSPNSVIDTVFEIQKINSQKINIPIIELQTVKIINQE